MLEEKKFNERKSFAMFAPRNSSPPLSQFTNSDDIAAHQVTSENARKIDVRWLSEFNDLHGLVNFVPSYAL